MKTERLGNNDFFSSSKRGIIAHYSGSVITHAWFQEGLIAIAPKVIDELNNVINKNNMTIENMLDQLADFYECGYVFCTGCGCKMERKKAAGRPMFAGIACKSCWEKHLNYLENNRKMGRVCRMCNQPYGNCCC